MRLFLGISLFSVALVVACQADAPAPARPELSFAHLGSIKLDVARVEVVRKYRQPTKEPNVEHLFPVNPLAAVDRWCRERLAPAGAAGLARATITQASVVEIPLKRTSGVRGWFTTDQSEHYDGLLEVAIRVVGADGGERGSVTARAQRSRTVPEGLSVNEREQVWFEITQAMMNDLDAALEEQIRAKLGALLR